MNDFEPMNLYPKVFAQASTVVERAKQGPSPKESDLKADDLMVTIAIGLFIMVVIVALVGLFRRSKAGRKRLVTESRLVPDSDEIESNTAHSRRRRRRRRRAHRPRNPTLAETGGLPPSRNILI